MCLPIFWHVSLDGSFNHFYPQLQQSSTDPLPITDSLSPTFQSAQSFRQKSLACLSISAANTCQIIPDASSKVYRAKRYEELVSRISLSEIETPGENDRSWLAVVA